MILSTLTFLVTPQPYSTFFIVTPQPYSTENERSIERARTGNDARLGRRTVVEKAKNTNWGHI